MLHELLVALHGYPGDVFISENDSIVVTNAVSFVHPAEEELLNRISVLAYKFKRVQEFVTIHKFSGGDEGIIHKLYANALASGIDEVLQPYKADLWQLELEVLADPCISLTHFLHLEKYLPLFQQLTDLIDMLEKKKPHGCQILDIVYEACNCGVALVEACMQSILKKCHTVLFRQISNWMVLGNLSDPYDEFFIALEPLEDQPEDRKYPKKAIFSQKKCNFILKYKLVPSYIPSHVAEKILFVGQSVGILDPDMYAKPLHRLMEPPSEFRKKENEYRNMFWKMSENEKFSPSEFISVISEIRAHCAEQVWKVVVEDGNLMSHLHTVKDYFLLGRGELFLAFIDTANKTLKMPATANSASDAHRAFLVAAKSTSSGMDKTAKQFHILVQSQRGSHGIDKTNMAAATLETGWSLIGIHYDVPFPLHIFFTSKVLEKYNEAFKFLLSVRRVQVDLHHCWVLQMNEKDSGRSSSLVNFWQLRAHMAFLLDNLQYYLQVDVLESHFADLLQKVNSVKDFEAVQRAHDQFLVSIISQCFLLSKHVYMCLQEILNMCSSFCSLLRKVDRTHSVSTSHVSQFNDLKLNFQRQTLLLFRILSGVRTHQSSPYLAQLLLRLDYNKYLSASGGHLGGPEMQST